MKTRLTLQVTLGYLIAIASYANAQDLVYTPVNPSFGGSPFNSAHLLAIAEIDRPAEPEDDIDFLFDSGLSQAEQFTRQLESRILSQLSFDIVDKIFEYQGKKYRLDPRICAACPARKITYNEPK